MKIRTFIFIMMLALAPAVAHAASEADDDNKSTSGLPVPRYASLRSDDVNMRTGPGTRYPIEWVFKRKGLPVEIITEYEIWRRVRDSEGAEGWVHKTALTGKRAAIITGSTHELHDSADIKSPVVAKLEVGALGQLVSCSKDWCKLKISGIKGYLRKSDFWGAKPDETFD